MQRTQVAQDARRNVREDLASNQSQANDLHANLDVAQGMEVCSGCCCSVLECSIAPTTGQVRLKEKNSVNLCASAVPSHSQRAT